MPTLSPIARHEYYLELGNALPWPVNPTAEHHEHRLHTAIEAFDTLCPGDAYEARLAAQVVLTAAHAAECLHEAAVYREDFAKRTRCRAQAATMLREERAARRMLAQEQKVRLAGEEVAGTQPAPASAPPRPAEPQAAPPPLQATAAAAAPQSMHMAPVAASLRATAPDPAPQPVAAAPSPEAVAQAEAFAQKHRAAAAWIRNDRGVTPRCKAHFRRVTMPTDPAVIDALIRGAGTLRATPDTAGTKTLNEAA